MVVARQHSVQNIQLLQLWETTFGFAHFRNEITVKETRGIVFNRLHVEYQRRNFTSSRQQSLCLYVVPSDFYQVVFQILKSSDLSICLAYVVNIWRAGAMRQSLWWILISFIQQH